MNGRSHIDRLTALPQSGLAAFMHSEPGQSVPSRFRTAEIVAALSLATDLGTGKQLERGLRTCLLGVRLGQTIGLSDARLTTVYYTVLLAMLGCTASSSTDTLLFGDELAMAAIVTGSRGEMLAFLVRHFCV